MEQALPTNDCYFDPKLIEAGDITSLTAEQYLSWVRHEAERLPDVVRADVDDDRMRNRQTKYMPEIADIPLCPDELLPSVDWERETLAAFSELRVLLGCFGARGNQHRKQAVPPMKDSQGWHRFCFGTSAESTAREAFDDAYDDDIDDDEGGAFDKEGAVLDDSHVQSGFVAPLHTSDGATGALPYPPDSLGLRKRQLCEKWQLGEVESIADTANECLERDVLTDADASPAVSTAEDLAVVSSSTHLHNVAATEATSTPVASVSVSGSTVTDSATRPLPEAVQPSPSLLMQFDQVLTQRVLAHNIRWLKNSRLANRQAVWLYALLARLEKPLFQDTAAMVRELYRHCCIERARLPETFSDSDDMEASLAALNLIITITGSYFGQGEGCITDTHSGHTDVSSGKVEEVGAMDGTECNSQDSGRGNLEVLDEEDGSWECAEDGYYGYGDY